MESRPMFFGGTEGPRGSQGPATGLRNASATADSPMLLPMGAGGNQDIISLTSLVASPPATRGPEDYSPTDIRAMVSNVGAQSIETAGREINSDMLAVLSGAAPESAEEFAALLET